MSSSAYREDDEVMETFVREMENRLEEMESGLAALVPGLPPDRDMVNAVFRAAHSLKAAANLLGYANVEAVTHRLETVLDALRSGRLTPGAGTIEALTLGLDTLHFLLEDLEAGDGLDVSEPLRRMDLEAGAAAMAMAGPLCRGHEIHENEFHEKI